MNRTLRNAGVVLVVLGMMLVIVPTGSYSTIASERGVGVSVAPDERSLIALEERTTTVNSSRWTTVAALVNNLDSAADVTYAVALDSDTLQLRSKENTSVTTTLTAGGTNEFELKCGTVRGSPTGTANLTVSVDAVATNATVTDATLTATVTYDCTAGANGTGGQQGPANGSNAPTTPSGTGNPN